MPGAAESKGAMSLGHVALHYPEASDGRAAARLLGLLGLVQSQALPMPDGSTFYRFIVDERHRAAGDGIVYLSAVPPAQKALQHAARAALGVGTDREHPAIAALRSAVAQDPEYMFHVGLLLTSLEELERIALDLAERAGSDPDFQGRLKITINRPRPGDPSVDARLDASPAFASVDRHAYGRNGVQLFVETDLLVGGPLGDALMLELDYVFPGHARHILSDVEL